MIIRIFLTASFGIPLAIFGILRRRNVNLALWTSGLFGVATILSALVARFWQTRNPIGAGMVESLGLFVFFLYAVVFLVRRVTYPRVLVMFLAAIVSLVLAFLPSNVFMPKNFAPILNSFWFYVHLPLFFAGYAALSLDFACVVLGERPILTWSFLLLCAGLISGGYWAFFAWGLPWSWDAKECWALGTLFFVAAAKRAHDDKLRNTFTVIAFCAMVFTFVGVAFLFASRHAYQ